VIVSIENFLKNINPKTYENRMLFASCLSPIFFQFRFCNLIFLLKSLLWGQQLIILVFLYFLSVIYMNYMWVVKESFSHILLYLMD